VLHNPPISFSLIKKIKNKRLENEVKENNERITKKEGKKDIAYIAI
jgi:hypothetical protein